LEPNPYRHIESYPIDRDKVNSLKNSIQQNKWWSGLIARPTENGKYQIAFGHHRLAALKELKIKEVEITVFDLTDIEMIRSMADENLPRKRSPAVAVQTVLAAKKYIEAEIAKYKSLKDLQLYAHAGVSILFTKDDNRYFVRTKKHSVGEKLVKKCLGKNWSYHAVRAALAILNAPKEVDRKAIEQLPSVAHARNFAQAVKRHKVPKEHQKGLATHIVNNEVGSKSIQTEIAGIVGKEKKHKSKLKEKPWLDDVVKETTSLMSDCHTNLMKIKNHLANIQSSLVYDSFVLELERLRNILNEMPSMEVGRQRVKRLTQKALAAPQVNDKK